MTTREVAYHRVNECNEALRIQAHDEVVGTPDNPGEPARYVVTLIGGSETHSTNWARVYHTLAFQHGPIKEAGVNGITLEVALAIVRDKLERHQASKHACAESGRALEHVKLAAASLAERTARRTVEGVEGTWEQDAEPYEPSKVQP